MMRQATAGRDDWGSAQSSSINTTSKGEKPVMSAPDSNEAQRELWNRVRARIKASVGVDVFTSWFASLELEEIVDDVVHLSAPTRFLCSWVQSNYAERLLEAFRQDDENVTRIQVTLRVTGRPGRALPSPPLNPSLWPQRPWPPARRPRRHPHRASSATIPLPRAMP
jgi:chromosomal replication initiator protein